MKHLLILGLILTSIVFVGCSGEPSSGLKKAEYEKINQTVKQILGQEYEAVDFTVLEEGFNDPESKTEYFVRFNFDLNKGVGPFNGIDIPGELRFAKRDGDWECTFNSGNAAGMFNFAR